MIHSFKCSETEKLYNGKKARKFSGFQRQAEVRLNRLDIALSLTDLAQYRGNRLEALSGDRKGQHSIRINDQWRICFRWIDNAAYDVEIVDYH